MSRYHKKIIPDANGLIDLYAIAEAFGVKSNPQFHAFKKTIMAGQRGDKGVRQDIDEAIQALQRWKEMVQAELVAPRDEAAATQAAMDALHGLKPKSVVLSAFRVCMLCETRVPADKPCPVCARNLVGGTT